MAKLLILTRYPGEYEPTRLAQEGKKVGMEPEIFSYRAVSFSWRKGKIEVRLGGHASLFDYQYLIPRAASKKGESLVAVKTALLRLLRPKQRCLNKESFVKYPLTSKMFQGLVLARLGLPVVPSFVFNSAGEWEQFAKTQLIHPPFILKGIFGSHGREVVVVESWEAAKKILVWRRWSLLIIQPLVKSSFWVRVLVLGGRILGAVRRPTKKRFLPNGRDGLKEEAAPFVLDSEGKEICLKAAKALACQFCGLDLIPAPNGGWWIIEVNRTPQFRVFEKLTGVNVAGEIVKFIWNITAGK